MRLAVNGMSMLRRGWLPGSIFALSFMAPFCGATLQGAPPIAPADPPRFAGQANQGGGPVLQQIMGGRDAQAAAAVDTEQSGDDPQRQWLFAHLTADRQFSAAEQAMLRDKISNMSAAQLDALVNAYRQRQHQAAAAANQELAAARDNLENLKATRDALAADAADWQQYRQNQYVNFGAGFSGYNYNAGIGFSPYPVAAGAGYGVGVAAGPYIYPAYGYSPVGVGAAAPVYNYGSYFTGPIGLSGPNYYTFGYGVSVPTYGPIYPYAGGGLY